MSSLVPELEKCLLTSASSDIARKQSAYLRNLFPFLGIQKPKRALIQKEIFNKHPISSEDELIHEMRILWEKDAREFKYAAMDLAKKYHPLWTPKILTEFVAMIRKDSWWDTVDLLSSNHLGLLLKRYDSLIKHSEKWIEDEHLWIRRTALLYQLLYKKDTDEQRLFRYIRQTMHEEDFFIRKAIGWALRQYAKTNPNSVRSFILQEKEHLSPLSIREASKYL